MLACVINQTRQHSASRLRNAQILTVDGLTSALRKKGRSSLIHWPEDRRIPIAFPVPIRGDAIAPLTRKPDLVSQYFCKAGGSRFVCCRGFVSPAGMKF